MLLHKWNYCLVFCLFLSLITACGGGGGDSSSEDDPQPDDGDGGTTSTQVNRNLDGYLFIAEDKAYLDINSGEYYAIEIDDGDYSIFPSSDGQEYVTTINNYQFVYGQPDHDAIVIKSMLDGRAREKFELSHKVIGAAKLSPDRRIVAAIWRDESSGEEYDGERLSLFSREGNLLGRGTHQDVTSFAWLSDGRLVYSVDDSIYITTTANDVSDSILINSFDTAMGKPMQLAVSPDDSRVVFELYTDHSPSPTVRWRDATVWMMDLDGGNLHLLATSNEEEPRINATAWSPDGSWVATVEGYIGGTTPHYDPFFPGEWRWEALRGIPGVLYAVPSSGDSVVVPGDGSGGAIPVEEYSGDNLAGLVRPGFAPNMKWLAEIANGPQNKGNLSSSGISGNLYFNDKGQGDTSALHSIDLQGNSDQVLFNLTDDSSSYITDLVYASPDGQLISHFCKASFGSCSASSNTEAINITDQSGQSLGVFPVEGSSYELSITGPARFSPTNTSHILVSYTDHYDDGDTFADSFIAVIDWQAGQFLQNFNSREYTTADWTPEGDILLAGEDGNVYLARSSNSGFSSPELHFSTKDTIHNLVVSPDGSRIAYTLNGQIWRSDVDGSNLRPMTGFSDRFNMFPEWSPAGDYIAFKHVNADSGPNDRGRIWIIAADSENVQIRDTDNTPNAIPLRVNGEGMAITGSFAWR
jgi:hypothetical protein